ncbi:hypothetical protein CBER1_05390 [Cercospora berteroae]|uniref:FAD/NAD(P)-binding domain-containing protein n=1 Tax=Cercospora berteroae TaxID=357750 RepID=A0A2S6C738_9PEZI|nr:hypothetical protein CBER1_05390 [Cercospora berteroae]
MAPRVAVIGGGPLGLIALKTFKQDGFEVTLYEALSALKTTKFNSSKFRSAIPGFPMPDGMDDFPTAGQLYKYFNDYANQFELWPHIRLGTKATELSWTGTVALATGSFTKPKFPKLDGIELFEGPADHCVKFHDPAKYKNQTVLIVGLHASAQDAIAALAGHATKVYVAHRSGLTLLPRYNTDGSVFDRLPSLNFTMFLVYLSGFLPAFHTWMMDFLLNMMSKKAYPNQPASWGLSPAPSFAVTTPLIASAIWRHLESGLCEPVAAVKRFVGPKSVELTSGRILAGIDSVIYCTGYDAEVPVKLPEEIEPYPVRGEPSNWYRHMHPIHENPQIRNSVALCAHGAFALPGFSQFFIQINAISQIWLGNSSLPSLTEMESWRQKYRAWRSAVAKKYRAQSTFYPFMVPMADYAAWLDRTAGIGIREHFGVVGRWVNWCAWKM